MTDQEKKIIADDDWKQQAQKEKEKLVKEDVKKAPSPEAPEETTASAQPAQPTLPPADISALVNMLAVQAMYYLGALPDPSGKKAEVNLDLAKYHVDLLSVMDEKTKGNLSEEENTMLSMALHEIRMLYVQKAS
ncbi:MAG: DUF1844 domain-containing protein [Phycisphaerae bacterium]|nr:DUF1844 domain-containing protein [Phycisphaerae bacterium]